MKGRIILKRDARIPLVFFLIWCTSPFRLFFTLLFILFFFFLGEKNLSRERERELPRSRKEYCSIILHANNKKKEIFNERVFVLNNAQTQRTHSQKKKRGNHFLQSKLWTHNSVTEGGKERHFFASQFWWREKVFDRRQGCLVLNRLPDLHRSQRGGPKIKFLYEKTKQALNFKC